MSRSIRRTNNIFVATDSNIHQSVNRYLAGNPDKLPPIGQWNTFRVTNMSMLFYNKRSFNEDISNWNTSNVRSLDQTFYNCTMFNQPLNNWNTSNVIGMMSTFARCYTFNQPLNNWNTSSVRYMSSMFYGCESFNQPLNNWDLSNVEDMTGMFEGCTSFNQDLSNWRVNRNFFVQEYIRNMFIGATSMTLRFFPRPYQSVIASTNIQNQTNEPRPNQSAIATTNIQNLPTTPSRKRGREETSNEHDTQENVIDPRLNELNSKIQVFNPLTPGDEPASQFFDEQSDYGPFIIRSENGKFNGDAAHWPATSAGGKIFVECKDDAPSKWLGNAYGKWLKPGSREFVKIIVSGSPTLVIKPDWYDSGIVPGTKYFRLIPSGSVFKFMSKVLASQNLPEDYDALGAEHCNQTGPIGFYALQEIPLDELDKMVSSGGKNTRKNKTYKIIRKRSKRHHRKTKRNRKSYTKKRR